jgi:hypothetical protein
MIQINILGITQLRKRKRDLKKGRRLRVEVEEVVVVWDPQLRNLLWTLED